MDVGRCRRLSDIGVTPWTIALRLSDDLQNSVSPETRLSQFTGNRCETAPLHHTAGGGRYVPFSGVGATKKLAARRVPERPIARDRLQFGCGARPGGNITGTTFFGLELAARRLELLSQSIPNTRQLAVLVNPANPVNGPVLQVMEKAAESLDIKLEQIIIRKSTELDGAFAQIAVRKLDGVAVFEDGITVANAATIAQLGVKQRLPVTGFVEIAKSRRPNRLWREHSRVIPTRGLFCR